VRSGCIYTVLVADYLDFHGSRGTLAEYERSDFVSSCAPRIVVLGPETGAHLVNILERSG
jgi:hypothetical protein